MTVKTSITHPLRIDSLTPLHAAGRIGMTFCPGKHQRQAATGTWARDLETDLAAITTWGGRALVCLLPQHELDELHVARLGEAARKAGLEFHHLPIADVDVPKEPFETLWLWSGLRLRTLLNAGRDIVVHCKGGLGRTGVMAARLLIETGEEPAAAVRRVRTARPGTIETDEQMQYVMNCRPRTDTVGVSPTRVDRAIGCILGGAVGDALGYCVEFDDWNEIAARHGARGIQAPIARTVGHGTTARQRYAVSDDTQMTLFTLEAVIAAVDDDVLGDLEQVRLRTRESMLRWLMTQRQGPDAGTGVSGSRLLQHGELFARRAPGTTCLRALEDGGHGTPGNIINASKGCGGVMRVAPFGLVPDRIDAGHAFALGAHAAAITHTHPSGYIAGGAMSAIINELMRGQSFDRAVDTAIALAGDWPHHEETTQALDTAMHATIATGDDDHPHAISDGLGEGWIAEEALAIALYAVRAGTDFSHVLRIAANHRGDSDSTASIAGQIYGAMNGARGLPHDWVDGLDVRDATLGEVRALLERG